MANKTSQHILGTSANLLGFCLIVLTSLHLTNQTQNNIIDELTAIVALLLTLSSFFSFISIKVDNNNIERKLEIVADYLFGISLIGIFTILTVIILSFWNK